jgi:hypothetical protein
MATAQGPLVWRKMNLECSSVVLNVLAFSFLPHGHNISCLQHYYGLLLAFCSQMSDSKPFNSTQEEREPTFLFAVRYVGLNL